MRIVIAVILALIAAAAVYFYTPDISHQELVAQYGGDPSKFITLSDGATAHYRDRGNPAGVPVVLLHGSNSSLFTWEGWIPTLAGKYRIITVDLPGHGLTGRIPGDDYSPASMEQFVDRFTSAIGVNQFVIGGNSMGGELAARMALDEPDHVLGLILVDAAGVTVPNLQQNLPLGFTLARMPVIKYLLLWFTPKSLVREGLEKAYSNPHRVTDAEVDLTWRLLRHRGNRLATLKRFSLPDARPLNTRIGHLTLPTLVLWGEDDQLLPLDMGKIYAGNIAGSQAVYFPHVGHLPQEEAPEKSAAVVAAFLQRFDAAPAETAPEINSNSYHH